MGQPALGGTKLEFVEQRVKSANAFGGHVATAACALALPGVFDHLKGVDLWEHIVKMATLFELGMVSSMSAEYQKQLEDAKNAHDGVSQIQLTVLWGVQFFCLTKATGVNVSERQFNVWHGAAMGYGADLGVNIGIATMPVHALHLWVKAELEVVVPDVLPQSMRLALWRAIYDRRSPWVRPEGDHYVAEKSPKDVLETIASCLPDATLANRYILMPDEMRSLASELHLRLIDTR